MNAGVGINKVRQFTDLKCERSRLKSSLHLTGTKEAEIATLVARAALAVLLSQALEVLSTADLSFDALNIGDGFLLGARNLLALPAVDGVA